METAKRTATLLILALLATTIAQSDETTPEPKQSDASASKISQTRTANCLVKVTADPSVVPLDMQTIQYLLESSAVAGKAARKVLGIASLQGPRPFEITVEQLTGPAGGYGGYYGSVGPAAITPARPSRRPPAPQAGSRAPSSSDPMERPANEQPVQPQQERGKTTTPRRSPTSSSSRSSSSTRPSSNQQTAPTYGSTAKTPATPTQPEPKATLGTTTSRYSSTSNPQSTQTTYGSSSRSRDPYRSTTDDGSYGGSYSRGSSTSTSNLYDAGSSSGYYSSYSRTPARPTTTRTTSRYSTTRPTTTRMTSRYSAATRPANATQTVFFRLQVDIPDDSAKPAANEFMRALVNSLREVLASALRDYGTEIQDELEFAGQERDVAQAQLVKIMAEAQPEVSIPTVQSGPADAIVKEQLDEIVDLSALEPKIPFSEALVEIKNSVDPPLNIVVIWRDLYDNAEIEQTTEINMNGPSQIPLHNGLSLMLKSVTGGVGEELGYSIDDGVITIATEYSVPRDMVTVVYEVPGLAYSGSTATALADVMVQTIEPESWLQNEEGSGEGEIAPYLGSKLVVRQTIEVHNKIRDFLKTVESNAPLAIPLDIPPETFLYEKQQLQRERRMLEMDVARLKARSAAIEQGVARISADVEHKLGDDPVTAELEKILEINATLLAATKTRYESGTISGAEIQQVEEKLARARIELAKRREELSKAAGGAELAKFNSELTSLAIDLAEKTAELQVLNTQLGQTEGQLAIATTLDPQLSELRYAKEAFDAAQQRVSRLKTRLANLVPPTVTVIGAD